MIPKTSSIKRTGDCSISLMMYPSEVLLKSKIADKLYDNVGVFTVVYQESSNKADLLSLSCFCNIVTQGVGSFYKGSGVLTLGWTESRYRS